MATAYFHAKYETTPPGYEGQAGATYGTKIIYFPHKGLNVAVAADPLVRDDEVRNQNDALAVFPDSYDPSLNLTTPGYADSLGFLLKWLLGAPTTTAGDGTIVDLNAAVIPVGATRHTWTSPGAASNTPQTCQVNAAYKDQTFFLQGNGVACQQLDLSMDDKELMAVADLPGLYMPRVADPSLTPAYETLTIQPFKPNNTVITTDLASASIAVKGGVDFSIANPLEKFRSMDIVSKWPNGMDKTDVVRLTGNIERRYVDPDDWDAFIANTGFAMKTTYTNDSIIASAYPYKLIISCSNCQYLAGDVDDQKNTRRHGAKYGFVATNAGSAAFTIQLVNATASYA